MDQPNLLNVAVVFGGKSAEHEISVITALQALEAMDTLRYRPFPVYISPEGRWFIGDALLDKTFYSSMPDSFKRVEEVILLPIPAIEGLTSLKSQKKIPVDVYFLAFHGQYGEDGCFQGLLEMAGAAYTGCGVLASAAAMHKHVCKSIVQQAGIPTLPSALVNRSPAQKDFIGARKLALTQEGLQFPLFVKPCCLGSSIGISIAQTEAELDASLAKVFIYDSQALVEPCVTDLLEINVAVLEGEPPQASVVETPVASGQALTYDDKYLRGGSKKSSTTQGMAGLTRVIDPVDLPLDIKELARTYAVQAFQSLGCAGVGRFDFIFDKKTEKLFFNELNPIPGSLSFYLWEKSSPRILYPDIIDTLIHGALRRKAEKLALQQVVGFKALKG